MSDRLPRAAIPLLIAACVLAGCGGSEKTVEITDVRERKDAGPPARDATPAERFRFSTDGERTMSREPEPPPGRPRWEWTTPAGWKETGGGEFREMGWTTTAPDVTASFSLAGGGTLANVNRWRGQMGLEPVDAAAIAALEKRTILGEPAVFVDLAGTYSGGGMTSGAKAVENARMLGLIAEIQGKAVFLKMTGPAAGVDAEKEKFLSLAASIRPSAARAPDPHGSPDPHAVSDPHAAPPPPASPSAAPPSSAEVPAANSPNDPYRWTAPESWTRQPDRSMRLATFRPKDTRETELVVSQFPGAAGGLADNVNRWRSQMGAAPLSQAEIAALPRARALGRTAVFVSMDGDYGGMDGRAGKKGWRFLGAVIEGDDQSVFVKMVGPAAEVRPEEDRFRAFVESLRE